MAGLAGVVTRRLAPLMQRKSDSQADRALNPATPGLCAQSTLWYKRYK